MQQCRVEEPPAFRSPEGVLARCHLHVSGSKLAGQSVIDLPPPKLHDEVSV